MGRKRKSSLTQQDAVTMLNEGISRQDMADKYGISRGTVGKIIKGGYHVAQGNSRFISNLMFGDVHMKFQDERAVSLMLKVCEVLNPDIITIGGDLCDCWELSHFTKRGDLRRKANLAAEIREVRDWLRMLRSKFPHSEIWYLYGNHEHRWDVYIQDRAPELYGLKGMTLAEQLELKEQDIQLFYSGNKETSHLWGKLLLGHFDRFSSISGNTARMLIADKGISLIQGHCHRMGAHYKRNFDRDIVGYENGCLCDLSPSWLDRPNWQLGFSIIYKEVDGDYFWVEQKPIIHAHDHYRVFYNGVVYEA